MIHSLSIVNMLLKLSMCSHFHISLLGLKISFLNPTIFFQPSSYSAEVIGYKSLRSKSSKLELGSSRPQSFFYYYFRHLNKMYSLRVFLCPETDVYFIVKGRKTKTVLPSFQAMPSGISFIPSNAFLYSFMPLKRKDFDASKFQSATRRMGSTLANHSTKLCSLPNSHSNHILYDYFMKRIQLSKWTENINTIHL